MTGTSAAAVMAALTLLAGCGSSSSSSTNPTATFKQAYQPAVNGFQQTSHAVALEILHAPRETDAQVESRFHALATQWQTHVNQIKGLKPPSSVAGAYARLSSAVNRAEADLSAAASAAQAHNVAAARHAGTSMVEDILAAKAAAMAINQKLGIK